MAHHDIDYDMDMSDDANEDLNTRNSRSTNPSRLRDPGKAKATPKDSSSGNRARWEAGAQKNWDLHEGDDGNLTSVLGGMEEATKRLRLQKDTTPLQRGIIRHCLLVLDLSQAMLEKDLRPTRFLLTLTYTMAFVREFFEQNPISQLGILGMRDGLAVRISELSGNPNDHISALKELRNTEPKGAASLQNALDMSRAALYHTPSHGTREVVIILGALSSADPGDIHQTINACIYVQGQMQATQAATMLRSTNHTIENYSWQSPHHPSCEPLPPPQQRLDPHYSKWAFHPATPRLKQLYALAMASSPMAATTAPAVLQKCAPCHKHVQRAI
ncbi:TFIIH basal transcription factor complex, subunit SSL1 [Aureobasidium sp. EXF-3400]|nr:TFIIH basal transcription factor complex, subunit SSL1 [Aureobasidium sp. EXF-12344]KAI4779937.1 TFIIH basal transcription factor complex, subunit SSL1 [Aureobasidium sp. EXF-3400]